MQKVKKVLLLGGGGYIGPIVAQRLLEYGYHVTIFDNLIYQQYQSTSFLFQHENFGFINGDLRDDAAVIKAYQGIDKLVILGGLVGDPITKKYPDESNAINVLGIQKSIDAISGTGINHVLFISTCSNYGLMPEGEIATEESPLKPMSLYAEAKVQAENYLLQKKGNVDYSATVLRFATAFGLSPRMRFDLTINEFTREIFLGNELVVYDADTWRPYCHVKDFARLIETVLSSDPNLSSFEIFNAGGDENNRTKRALVQNITDQMPNAKISYKDHGVDPRNYKVDFDKVKRVLGFKPEYSIDYGIKEVINALRAGIFADFTQRKNFYGNYKLLNHKNF